MVASVCAALVGAAALTLLVNGASAAARVRDRNYGAARTRACRDALVTNLVGALAGLEGAGFVRRDGAVRPRLEPRANGVTFPRQRGNPVEVARDADGRYRLPAGADAAALVPGALVAALPPVADAVVVGTVVGLDSSVAGDRVDISWGALDTSALPDPVRALTPIRWRELAVVGTSPAAVDLRRRDEGGNWQRVVDGLAQIELRYAADTDMDGLLDGPPSAWDVATLPVAAVRASCRAPGGLAGIRAAALSGWAR
jgi:hypothetical protein